MEATFYPNIVAIGWIGVFLLLGVFLRSKVKFLQTTLLPAALIGGIIGFFFINSELFGLPVSLVGVPTSQGWKEIIPRQYSILVFHLFAFGFVGLGMLEPGGGKKNVGQAVLKGSLWVCLVFAFSYAAQALTGYGVFQFFDKVLGFDIDPVNGFLVASGFTQGPGQAQSTALIWENSFQTQYAVSAGIAFAAVGFLVAGLVGVALTFFGIKKGWASDGSGKLSDEFRKGLYNKGNNPVNAHATAHPANIDSFALHLGLFVVVYLVAYCWAVGWGMYAPKFLKALGVGLNFIWCLYFGIILRKLAHKLGFAHLIDQDTVRRITGTSVDIMLCAVFMSIAVADIATMLAPFLVTCILATIATVWFVMFFSRRQKEYGFERMVATFGLCTGTAASGLLLLRIIDPDFESPAAVEIGLFNVFAIFVLNPYTLTKPFAPGIPGWFVLMNVGYLIAVPLVIHFMKLGSWKKQF